MSLFEKIIEWSNAVPDWQKEAIRRLLIQESLTSEDQEHLYQLFKKDYGLLEIDVELSSPKPLKKEEILGTSGINHTIVLKKIQEIRNANALPDNSELLFSHNGLTVIYGENAAGKSGYARILKKACFARDDKEKIHSNIFVANLTGPAEATFKLGIDEHEEFSKWTDGQPKPEILANICVFDSKCARIIVNNKNAVSYLPYGADVFQKLAAIVREFKNRLEQEKPIPVKPEISDLPENTKAGVFFKFLNAQTKDEDLAQFQWTEQDDSVFNPLSVKYVKAQAGDTTKQIRVLENLKSRLNSFKEKFSEYAGLFSSKSIKSINQLIESRNAFQKAFEVVSHKPDGPLRGIATNEWQALYWAAKEYSIKQAYQGEIFPVTGKDKKCVLCMQPLSDDASDRLNKFQKYMENSTKKSLDDTSTKLTERIDQIKNLDFDKFQTDDYKDVLDEIEGRNKELAQNISESISQFANIRDALTEADSDKTLCSEECGNFDFAELEKLPELINSEIRECQKNSNPQGLEKLKTELTELNARKQFAKNQKAIIVYLESLRKLSLYNHALGSLNTNSITRKGTDLVGQAQTPRLKAALSEELRILEANHIPLDIKHFGSAGENTHQMKIEGQANTAEIKLTEILSEGEQRVIAIAGFLAELSLQDNATPIVFDDPVSSLDHKFSEKIAVRLVQESAKRQVVVFTHNISFLLDLQEKSESRGQYCHCVNVHREKNVAGLIRGEVPWHAMSVNKRLNFIEQEVLKIVDLYTSNQPEYNQQVGTLYGYLREAWEAAIEECLFNKVICRFQAEVKTLRLRDITIKESDCDTIEEGMTKCSKWMIGHSLSRQISDDRPAPHEFKEDIKKLRDFVHTMKRRKTTNIGRQIPIPEIG